MSMPLATSETRPRRRQRGGAAVDAEILVFRLAGEDFGLDRRCIRATILLGELAPALGWPEHVIGHITLNGSVIPIVDLRRRFGLPVDDCGDHMWIIVAQIPSRAIGIVANAVGGIIRVREDQIETPREGMRGVDRADIRGTVWFEGKLLILPRMEAVFVEPQVGADRLPGLWIPSLSGFAPLGE